jgi:hypothetical protein
MSIPEKVFNEATGHLEQRRTEATTTFPGSRLSVNITGHPVEDSGYVYAQVGWLDNSDGTTYGLTLPDNMDRDGVTLRPLYICLGRHTRPPDVYAEPCE